MDERLEVREVGPRMPEGMLRHPGVRADVLAEGPRMVVPSRRYPPPVIVGDGPDGRDQAGVGCPEARDRLLPAPGLLAFDLGGIEEVEGRLVGDRVPDVGRTARTDVLDRAEGDLLPGLDVAGEVSGRLGAAPDRPPGFCGIPAQSREQGVERLGALGEDGRGLGRRLVHCRASEAGWEWGTASSS